MPRNISISAWRQKRDNIFFQKVVSFIWGQIVLFLVIVVLYFCENATMNSYIQPFQLQTNTWNPFVQSLPSVPLSSLSWGKYWEHTSNVTKHIFHICQKNKWAILENPPFLRVLGVAEDWGGGWVLKRSEPLLPRCWVSTLWWRRLNLGHWVAEAEITDLILI